MKACERPCNILEVLQSYVKKNFETSSSNGGNTSEETGKQQVT